MIEKALNDWEKRYCSDYPKNIIEITGLMEQHCRNNKDLNFVCGYENT